MAQTRKDLRGRVLRKGESQRRSDERYVYTYTDPLGRRKYVYAQDLVTLREKEAQLLKDQMDGLDIYVAGKATVNFVFDRYMSLKNNLKPTTKSNYLYMYDRFVRDTFGKRNIAEIKYSDVVQFYNYLVEKQELQINTLETVHTLLHPTFQLAVRDDIIRKNPSDGVMAELKKNLGMKTGVRHALTIPQQRAFIEYIATHPIYYHWWPIFTVFLGTGCRIGEVLGLRWEDINYEKRIICVNHNLTYYPVGEDRASENHISTPKTEAGMRTIPMLDAVKDAFEMIWEEQKAPPVELIQFVNNEVKKVPSDLFTTSISEVCFYTDDIDSAYKHLVDNNVECLSEPQYFDFRADGFGESRAFYFRDPDGIILEMMQPL